MKRKVVAIVGPTAVGKTKLGIEMAKQFNGEIISGDSMQVYRGMDIGTAKATKEEQEGIPHYLLDIKEPSESFTTADFQKAVRIYVNQISTMQKLPIIVGGSGLYVQSALFDYNFTMGKRDETLTKKMEEIVAEKGILPLYKKLKEIDPQQAEKIHPNNHRRVIRALEIYETSGKTMTQLQSEQTSSSPFQPVLIGLEMDRTLLYERINERVDQMIDQGLLEEVRALYDKGLENAQSMKAIGYKELIPYIRKEKSLEDCVELLKRNSRRYAKRQYTWFKNRMNVRWYTITPDTYNKVFPIIFSDLKGIIQR